MEITVRYLQYRYLPQYITTYLVDKYLLILILKVCTFKAIGSIREKIFEQLSIEFLSTTFPFPL